MARWTWGQVGLGAIGVAAAAFAAVFAASGVMSLGAAPAEIELAELPDRYTTVMLPSEGAPRKGKTEEGKVGRRAVAADAGEGAVATVIPPSPVGRGAFGVSVDGAVGSGAASGGAGTLGLGLGGRGGLGGGGVGIGGGSFASKAPARPSASDVATDPRSTFAVDVDTGSWTLVTHRLEAGAWPPPSLVRVEELINAQDYTYPLPTTGPLSVTLEGAPDPDDPARTLLAVALQTRAPAAHRKPVRLTLLVDVSGSMAAADRLPLAVRMLREMVTHLDPEDSVSIVTFAQGTQVWLEPTPATSIGRARIDTALAGLRSGGGTELGAGLRTAMDRARAAYVDGAENKVMLVSDGLANGGEATVGELSALVKARGRGGITLTTLGMGAGAVRDEVLERLADVGDGQYHVLSDERQARRILVDRLGGTLETVVADVKVQVTFDARTVRDHRLIGYANRAVADDRFRDDATDGGELGAGHAVTALYSVALVPGATGQLATVSVRGRPPGLETTAVEWETTLGAEHLVPTLGEASPSMRLAAVTAVFGARLREGPGADWAGLEALADAVVDPTVGSGAALLDAVHRAGDVARSLDAREPAQAAVLTTVEGSWR